MAEKTEKKKGWFSNTVDAVVNAVSPQRALDRKLAEVKLDQVTQHQAKYNSGGTTSKSVFNFNPPTQSANAELEYDLENMRDRSRDLANNFGLARGAIKTVVNNVVGTGLKANIKLDRKALGLNRAQAKKIEDKIKQAWNVFIKECDISRKMTFDELTLLVLEAELTSGDAFAEIAFKKRPGDVFGTKVNVIEADRCTNPNNTQDGDYTNSKGAKTGLIAGGVLVDEFGAPMKYFFSKGHPGDTYNQQDKNVWKGVSAYRSDGVRHVCHILDQDRPDQNRGVPYLAPAIESFKQLQRYHEAELDAAVMSSMIAMFVTNAGGESLSSTNDGSLPGTYNNSSTPNEDVQLASGTVTYLEDGQSVDFADPKRPNTSYAQFVESITREISAGLEIPYEILINDFSKSFSASRANLAQAWRFFSRKRSQLISQFCKPVYEAFLTELINSGQLIAPGFNDPMLRSAWLDVDFNGPAPTSLDPVKELKAAKLALELKLSTHKIESARYLGKDWDTVNEQLNEENTEIATQEALIEAILNAQNTEPLLEVPNNGLLNEDVENDS